MLLKHYWHYVVQTKKWIPCLNLSLFRPVWNLVYKNKWHLCNVQRSSQVQLSWTEKKDKNFKGDNRISADSTNTFQEQSWLQDRFKKQYSARKVTYITVKNTHKKRQQYVVNLITEVKHQKNEGRQNKKYQVSYISFEDEAKNLK